MEIDILKMLERKDKWYLGGGNRLLWTPPFPLHLDRPGAWDFVSYFDLRIDPGYTISVIAGEFRSISSVSTDSGTPPL